HGLTPEPLHQLPSPSPLLVFSGLQAQTIQKLSQREGSNLSVLCHYPAEDEYRELKSWCRWTDQGCQLQVATSGTRTHFYTYRARQGHFTIKDDPIHKNFSITMTDLQVEDSGIYYCAYSQINVPLKWISLNVFKGEYLFPTQTPVLSGGNVTAALLHTLPAHSERLPLTSSISPHPRLLACHLPCFQRSFSACTSSTSAMSWAGFMEQGSSAAPCLSLPLFHPSAASPSGRLVCVLCHSTPKVTPMVAMAGTFRWGMHNSPVIVLLFFFVIAGRVATTLSGTSQNYLPGNSTQAG
uniref:Ig-like domain-containing protein n=1 Tax=Anas zonorhyncha TaxID=75864 RepID=A0A8B9UY14_9AVES